MLLVVGAAVLVMSRPATAERGRQVPIEGNRQHVNQGTDMPYRNRPPSSGDHYPSPAGYGVFTRTIPAGNLVHALEHGAIVVYYRPDLCDQACVEQLRQAYNSAPRSRTYGVVKMVVAPWQDMDHAAARLVISEHTVKNHLKNILAKLQLRSRRQAAAYGVARGWVRPRPGDG
jgi:hypothetical protein